MDENKGQGKIEFKKNCYEFPIELNQSDRTEALKCIDIAQAAFQESKYDKAERFLLKSLRICESEGAKSLLETVRNAQNKTNGTVETEEYNELVNDHPNEEMNKYNIYLNRATKAIDKGNLAIAERFLSKAIQINPNDDALKQLKHIQELRETQASNDGTITSKKKVVTFAADTKTGDDEIDEAHNYGEQELENQQSEEMTEHMNKLNLKTAEECIENAQSALDEGKYIEALELLTKAEKIYPNRRAEDLMKLGDLIAELKHVIAKEESNDSQPESKTKEVPSEYISEIQRVEKADDDFSILGIPEGATLDEVDKAYKCLTKILHPDKNKAPGAEDAFMKVKDAKNRIMAKQS